MNNFLFKLQNILNNWTQHLEDKYIHRNRKISSADFLTTLINLSEPNSSYSLALTASLKVSKSSFWKFRNKIPSEEFQQLAYSVDILLEEIGLFSTTGTNIYAIDGSKILMHKNLFKKGYTSQINPHFPQGLISGLSEVSKSTPRDLLLVSHKNERACALQQLKFLQTNDILIMDRGYFSLQLAQACIQQGIRPIFRMKKSSMGVKSLLQNQLNDQEVSIGTKNNNFRLRIVRYKIGKQDYFLATTLFDKAQYPISYLMDLYHSRWDIEEHFKFFKTVCDFKRFHSHTENGIKQEMYLSLFLIKVTRALEFLNIPLLGKINNTTKRKFNSKVLFCKVRGFISDLLKNTKARVKKVSALIKKILKSNILSYKLNRTFPRYVKTPTTKEKYNNLIPLTKRKNIKK